jgi:hypothetical protein
LAANHDVNSHHATSFLSLIPHIFRTLELGSNIDLASKHDKRLDIAKPGVCILADAGALIDRRQVGLERRPPLENTVGTPSMRCRSWPSEARQFLSQPPQLAYLLPQPSPRGDRLSGVAAMLVVSIARPLRSPRSWCATMHPAAHSPGHGGRPAWRS